MKSAPLDPGALFPYRAVFRGRRAAVVGMELSPPGALSAVVGSVMAGRVVSFGSVAWVAVGEGMMVGRVVGSSVIMPPGWSLTLAEQPQPVSRAAVRARASARLRICFIAIPPVRMLTEVVCRTGPAINEEIFMKRKFFEFIDRLISNHGV